MMHKRTMVCLGSALLLWTLASCAPSEGPGCLLEESLTGPDRQIVHARDVGYVPPPRNIHRVYGEIAAEVPNFGGMYTGDQGELVLLLTDSASEDAVLDAILSLGYEEYLEGSDGEERKVRVEVVQFSYRQLRIWERTAHLNLRDVGGVRTDAIDVVRNSVDLILNAPRCRSTVLRVLEEAGIPAEAITFEIQ